MGGTAAGRLVVARAAVGRSGLGGLLGQLRLERRQDGVEVEGGFGKAGLPVGVVLREHALGDRLRGVQRVLVAEEAGAELLDELLDAVAELLVARRILGRAPEVSFFSSASLRTARFSGRPVVQRVVQSRRRSRPRSRARTGCGACRPFQARHVQVLVQHGADLLAVRLPVGLLDLLEVERAVGQDGPGELQVRRVGQHAGIGREGRVRFDKGVGGGAEDEPPVLGAEVGDDGLHVRLHVGGAGDGGDEVQHGAVGGAQLVVQLLGVVHGRGHVLAPVGRERLVELLGYADVVHDQAVRLAPVHPVGAGDGLEQRVVRERVVEVHRLLDGRVEAGEQLVADDHEAERIVRVLEAGDDLRRHVLGRDLVRDQFRVLLAVVLAGAVDADRHLGGLAPRLFLAVALGLAERLGDDAVEPFFVGDAGAAVDGADLGLEAVRQDVGAVVGPDVFGDEVDAGLEAGEVAFGDAAALELFDALGRLVGKPLVEEHVDLFVVQVPLGHAALVVDGHRGAVGYGVVDAVLVEVGFSFGAEVLEGVLVALFDGRAGEAEARGVREHGADGGAEVFLLRPVRLVHHQDPVLGAFHGQLFQGGEALGVDGRLQPRVVGLELEDGRQHHLAGRAGRDERAEPLDAIGRLDVLDADGRKGLRDLGVEVDAVGDDEQVRVLEARALEAAVGFQLERGEDHREALARALGVPDEPGAVLALHHALHHLVDGAVLLVAADLFDGLAALRLEHDEVGQDVEQPLGGQQGVESLLGLVCEVASLARPRVAPRAPELLRGAGGAVLQRDVGGGDVEEVAVEQARHLALGGAHLVDGVVEALALVGRALGLDDDERDAIDVHHHVGLADDGAAHAELVGAGEVVVLDVVEVEEADGAVRGLAGDLARVVAAQDLGPALVVGEAREVGGHGAGGGLGNAVDADERGDEQRREQHLVLARPQAGVLGFRDEAVAVLGDERVEQRLLDQRVLVGRAHGVTRTAPVRRSWRSPALTCSVCRSMYRSFSAVSQQTSVSPRPRPVLPEVGLGQPEPSRPLD